MRLSVIIPALNEANNIRRTLLPLQALRQEGHEIILCDGGSEDDTKRQAQTLVDKLLDAPRGRAHQMNAGAAVATGNLLLFLHADTLLPDNAAQAIAAAADGGTRPCWGRFDVRLSGRQPLLRLVEWMMNQRSRITGIATGDQGMFIQRTLFHQIGGFPPLALMEDITLSRTLKRHAAPICLRAKVTTSSRRWEEQGIVSTIFLMWRMRLAYFFGACPQRLAHAYQREQQR